GRWSVNELGPIHYTGSANGLFALIFDPATPGNVFVADGSSSAAWATATASDAALDDYDVPMTDAGSGHYFADLPAGLSAATTYIVHVYERAGADPDTSDLANLLWAGTVGPEIDSRASQATASAIEADTQDIQTQIGTAGSGLTNLGDTRLANLDAAISSRGTADPGDAMALVDDAITASKFDESTAFPLASADSGSTQIARTGADGKTLEDISEQITGIASPAGPGSTSQTWIINDNDGNPLD